MSIEMQEYIKQRPIKQICYLSLPIYNPIYFLLLWDSHCIQLYVIQENP